MAEKVGERVSNFKILNGDELGLHREVAQGSGVRISVAANPGDRFTRTSSERLNSGVMKSGDEVVPRDTHHVRLVGTSLELHRFNRALDSARVQRQRQRAS